jgi:hypothetical protein
MARVRCHCPLTQTSACLASHGSSYLKIYARGQLFENLPLVSKVECDLAHSCSNILRANAVVSNV